MIKYRIRLANGRVIGPFTNRELFQLKAQGHILGNEEAQEYPVGNWSPLNSFEFYEELMDKNKTIMDTGHKEETFIIDLSKVRLMQNEAEIEMLNEPQVQQVELTETVRLAPNEEKKEEHPSSTAQVEEREDKTIINPIAQKEIERMRREAIEVQIKIDEEEQLKKSEEEKRARELEDKKNEVIDESTQMIRLDSMGSLIKKAEQEEEKIEIEEKKRKLEKQKDELEEVDEEMPKKKKISPLILIVAVLAIGYAILFPDDDKNAKPQFQNLPPQIIFPIPFDKADINKSKDDLNTGHQNFIKGTYPNIVKAGLFFKTSYENNLDNSDALNMMVRSYGEELKNSKQLQVDALTLFNIIRAKRPFLMQDSNGVIGLNLFYMAINKPEAAADIVAKYLKLYPQKVTQDLFSFYLTTLLKIGKIDTAKQFYQALDRAPKKNQYAYQALFEYLILNQEIDKAMSYLDEAIKKYPNLVFFYLAKADLMLKQGQKKGVVELLRKAEDLNLENNDRYRAKSYELQGLLAGLNNKIDLATALLKKSLALSESDDLRLRLAELSNNSNSEETNKLITESQAIKLLIQAKDFFEKKNYELALSSAARATDVYSGYVPAELFLSKVQLKLGLAGEALKTLEKLKNKYPDDKEVNFALINAYIDTYKFNDAKNLISNISTTKMHNAPEFASVNARLFVKMSDSLQAISWLKNSMNLNPFNDHDIYMLAEILIKKANFDAAKTLLDQCMELNPINPDYRIAYAKIVYETQDDQAAVGYLLNLMNEFGENPKVLGEIAIFYYRAGKVKDFEDYKAKLEKLPVRDRAFYDFLIRAALLDERYDEIPSLVEKLLDIEPGDLESMMTAGRVLFENGKLVEAAKWFKRVQDKLSSYPKVQYYIARIKFLSRDFDGALAEVKKDIAANGENDGSLVLLAQIYVEKSDLVEAENQFKRAQKLNPNSYEALVGLAELSTKRNNYELALDLYKKAMRVKSDEPLIHKKIGDVYRLLGQGGLAIESYKLYLEMDPESAHKGQIESYIKLMQ